MQHGTARQRYFSNMILNIANILTTLILGYWQNLPNILPYNSIRSVWRAPYTLFSNTLLCSPVSYQPPELVRGHTHMGASKITVKIIRTHYYTAGENTTQNIICQRWRTTRASQERPASRSGRRGASHGSRGSAKSKVRATRAPGRAPDLRSRGSSSPLAPCPPPSPPPPASPSLSPATPHAAVPCHARSSICASAGAGVWRLHSAIGDALGAGLAGELHHSVGVVDPLEDCAVEVRGYPVHLCARNMYDLSK